MISEQPARTQSKQPSVVPGARALAWALAGLALTLAVAGAVASIPTGTPWYTTHMLFGPVAAIAYGLVGALVASRQPRNAIGWLFCVEGVLAGLTMVASSGARLCMWSGAGLGCIDAVRWLGLWIWIPTSLLPLTFLLLLFPDGRLPSPRWRPIAWAAGLGLAAYSISTALHPRPEESFDPQPNPFGIPAAVEVLELLNATTIVLIPVGVFGALASLMVRFRRSHGVERDQIKWLAYGSAVAILNLLALSAWSSTRPFDRAAYEVTIGSVWVALTVIVVAAGVAILRYHLYDIDLLINRTLVYGALSAGVVGLYVLLVGALGALFQTSGNPLVALLATGLAALLIQPLRARLQRAVNRLMYGDRDDPYAVLSGLSQQLKSTLAPGAVLPRIAQTVAQALKLPYVALALQQGDRLEVAAAYGRPAGEPLALPLVYQAEPVGQLLVARRAANEPFTPAERRLLDDIALQAGVAAHACASPATFSARASGWRRRGRRSGGGCTATCTTGWGHSSPASRSRSPRPGSCSATTSTRLTRCSRSWLSTPRPQWPTCGGWSTTCAHRPWTTWGWCWRCASKRRATGGPVSPSRLRPRSGCRPCPRRWR